MKKIVQAYTFTRIVDGLLIPTNIQSSIIRNYCESNNFQFKLHFDEYCKEKSYVQLFQILNSKIKINSIAMCSVYFLPKEKKLLEKILLKAKQKQISIIFIFENIIFKKQNIGKFIKEINLLKKINKINSEKKFIP